MLICPHMPAIRSINAKCVRTESGRNRSDVFRSEWNRNMPQESILHFYAYDNDGKKMPSSGVYISTDSEKLTKGQQVCHHKRKVKAISYL